MEKWIVATNVDRGEGKKGYRRQELQGGKDNRQMGERAGAIGKVDEQQGQLEERSDRGGGMDMGKR